VITGGEPTPAGPWRVLGLTLAVLAFVGALFTIGSGLLASPLDGAERQRELFGERPPPLGLVLDSAVRLPTGDALVRFTRPAGSPDGTAPLDAVFLEYKSRTSAEAQLAPTPLEGMGGPEGMLKEWEKEKATDWSFTRKRGDVSFGSWTTKYLLERSYVKGGGWSEEARVDLSTPGRALVLFSHWPPEKPVDEARLRELLAALELPAPAD